MSADVLFLEYTLKTNMETEFLKLQSAGSDYIIYDAFKSPLKRDADVTVLAKKICNRHFGVGGKGLVILQPGEKLSLRIRNFQPTGQEVLSNGASLICAARYAYDTGLVNEDSFSVETMDGLLLCEVMDSSSIRAEIGYPRTTDGERIITESLDRKFTESILIDNREYSFTPCIIDSYRMVMFVGENEFPAQGFVRKIEQQMRFQGQESIDFVKVVARDEIIVRSWEHKTGETSGCGAGAGAAVVASVLSGFVEREVVVHLKTGDLFVEWDQTSGKLFCTGMAEYVFSGRYYIED
ncbi:MAG: diaminopimelate epimerase [Spirochaetaceae bacterium]|nr:MAG: diaminopimelate epimerase [Spirochaetaceae bacterium]